jgi:hypothetical protein
VKDKAGDTEHLFIREERREDSDAKNAVIGLGICMMGREVRVHAHRDPKAWMGGR